MEIIASSTEKVNAIAVVGSLLQSLQSSIDKSREHSLLDLVAYRTSFGFLNGGLCICSISWENVLVF